jgi:predicted unusual protein kinase regulating ubiquinone biosynthesis (AarF/ABC1/UbiB family)
LQRFFACRPLEFVSRVGDFYRAWLEIRESWYQPGSSARHAERGARLRNQLALLGPVAVKLGQTLSQRPDILDEEICEELKPLQTANRPFDDADAMALLAEELEWDGPIAPGVCAPGCPRPDGPPLFASISASPVASASLGQVYRAVTRSGADVAVKVQRPSAMRQVALDFAVLTTLLWLIQRSGWGNGDLVEIIDIVAGGVFQEMDYRNEARNAVQFDQSLSFLGYVSVPKASPEFLPTPRLLVTDWVHGRHLGDLTKKEGLRMTKCVHARLRRGRAAERSGRPCARLVRPAHTRGLPAA